MKKRLSTNKQGKFHFDTLIVEFGGAMSKPENIFTALAIKVPPYSVTYYERESLGNGWYLSSKEKVTKVIDGEYLIIKDTKCIGYMYPSIHDHKSTLLTLDYARPEVIKFLGTLNIPFTS